MTAALDAPAAEAAILFETLAPQVPDALLGVIALHHADQRVDKIDLGVGVYRDDAGATPVMRAVKAAERKLVQSQPTKAYLGAEGNMAFTDLLGEIVLGDGYARNDRLAGVRTPGGTGALRLGAELIARTGTAGAVWIGTPTWPNHVPIFEEAGFPSGNTAFTIRRVPSWTLRA